MTAPSTNPPAGFYDFEGRQRWWDGTQWTEHFQSTATPPPVQPSNPVGPMTSANLNVKREVIYTRQQQGHSVIVWTLVSIVTGGLGLIWVIYYTASPNHYWRA
jgi:hypothetical protein